MWMYNPAMTAEKRVSKRDSIFRKTRTLVEIDGKSTKSKIRSSEDGAVRAWLKRVRAPKKERRDKSMPDVIYLEGPEDEELVKTRDAQIEKAVEVTTAQKRFEEDEDAQDVEQLSDFKRRSSVSREQQQRVEG